MPTTYTHFRFGEKASKTLNNDLQTIINKYRNIFDYGVHGPDIFFYYKPIKANDVSKFGNEMHFLPAKLFFEKCKKVYESHEEKEAMMAYILGFLTHFSLDSTCHGYVDRKKEVSNISHNKIEAQYDRHMMIKDNINPIKFNRGDCLKPDEFVSHIISYFFDFDEKTIFEANKSQKKVMFFLHTPHSFKRILLRSTIKLVLGSDSDLIDLFIDEIEDPLCKDSNLRLDKLSEKALVLYPKLVNNFINYINGKEELDDYFNHNFEFWPDYKSIPILSYEDEINYSI